jgi:CDP-glucose 4,6-dehydratase
MGVDIFDNFFRKKKILITGGTGFKGSWLITWLLELGAEVHSYSLEPLRKEDNFVTSGLDKKINNKIADVLDKKELSKFFHEVKPDIAFHLAAQPIVLSSYKDPAYTFEVNVMGTVNFLDAVRTTESVKAAVIVTSDKCYQNNEWVWGYRESDAMGGNDPYSASKGCAELVTASYLQSFFKKEQTCHIASARAGNVIGGGDWSDYRIIADFFKAVNSNQSLSIRNPEATRPWQFVLEPLYGYLALARKLFLEGKRFSGGWNFGPLHTNHHTVLDIVSLLAKKLKLPSDFIKIETNQNNPHESSYLKLDISKASQLMDWKPVLNFDQTIDLTLDSYKQATYADRVNQILTYISIYKNNI